MQRGWVWDTRELYCLCCYLLLKSLYCRILIPPSFLEVCPVSWISLLSWLVPEVKRSKGCYETGCQLFRWSTRTRCELCNAVFNCATSLSAGALVYVDFLDRWKQVSAMANKQPTEMFPSLIWNYTEECTQRKSVYKFIFYLGNCNHEPKTAEDC